MKRYSARHIMVLTLTILIGTGTVLSGLHAATENIILNVAVDVDSLSSLGGDSNSNSDVNSDVDLLCSLSSCSGGCFVGALSGVTFVSPSHATELFYIEAAEAYQKLLQPDPFPPKDTIVT